MKNEATHYTPQGFTTMRGKGGVEIDVPQNTTFYFDSNRHPVAVTVPREKDTYPRIEEGDVLNQSIHWPILEALGMK